MNIQIEIKTIKKELDEIQDENLIQTIKSLLKFARKKNYELTLKPMTKKQYKARAEASEEDIKTGRTKDINTLAKESRNWQNEIIITANAEERLREIYDYYKREASINIADKIKASIIEKVKLLKNFKELGSIDEQLKYLKLGHRKIPAGNYKIVYRSEKNTIYITDIFDTQQDPDKQK